VVLKLRYADQVVSTRSVALGAPTAQAGELGAAAAHLLDRTQAGPRPVRTIGVQVARLAPAGQADRQLDLFPRG
jgi:DNA polymerase-4